MNESLKILISIMLVIVIIINLGVIYAQRKGIRFFKKGRMSFKDRQKIADTMGKNFTGTVQIDSAGNVRDMNGKLLFTRSNAPDFMKPMIDKAVAITERQQTAIRAQSVDAVMHDLPDGSAQSPFLEGLYENVPVSVLEEATSEIEYMSMFYMLKYRVLYYCREHNIACNESAASFVADNIMSECELEADDLLEVKHSKSFWDARIQKELQTYNLASTDDMDAEGDDDDDDEW